VFPYIPEEEVHDGGGVDVAEQQLNKSGLGLDVVDHLEAGELVRIPILPQKKQQSGTTHKTETKTSRKD
jgi:hypothetical protein